MALDTATMEIHGKNFIGSQLSGAGETSFRAYDPRAGEAIGPSFHQATEDEVNQALGLADEAAARLRGLRPDGIASFLMAVREEIAGIGDVLIERAERETGLDEARLKGERERTLNQIKLFADLVTEGSWVDARIDTALPERKPLPRPDIRRMLQPIGPVVVFGASNFPLAFSVGGGDTISAFAARNPVVVKAHPAHPGTSELVAGAIARAVRAKSMPEGTFSMLHSKAPETSVALVTHAKTRAVGFTGSQRAGRALFDAAARRSDPIPVYAEMGSVNPVFVLSDVLRNKGEAIAEGVFRSVLLGVGQFCTSPGLVFGVDGENFQTFQQKLIEAFKQASPGSMLNPAIAEGYREKFKSVAGIEGVEAHSSLHASDPKRSESRPGVLVTSSETWLRNKELHEEMFGPGTVLVHCGSQAEMLEAAAALEGSLTATIHGTDDELKQNSDLMDILSRKAGRLIFNGYPTGVEVGYAMHHGGPYPATTDEKFTSVGTAAIYRFARPVCYQGFPQHLLPEELQDANPRKIWRTVNGRFTQDGI
jgi:2,5-dioxopentanoate dehydrogenase